MFMLANLDQEKLKQLHEFEQKKGVKVLAFADIKVDPAKIEEEKVKDMKTLEECLGVTLVAYQ